MLYGKLFSMCAAVGITIGGLLVMTPHASAGQRPIVVTSPAELVVRHISYADLNLASLSGEKTLKYRVGGAVRSLCDEVAGPDTGDLQSTVAIMECGKDAWGQARPQMARAVARAHEIALTGTSTIAATAITISLDNK